MTLSAVEHWLTIHIRSYLHPKFHITTLRKAAFVIALVSCIASGLVTIISLFTKPWRNHMHYTALEINLISSAVNLGGYLTPPLLGILSDSHGPVVLSWLAVAGFVPSYAYSSYIFVHGEVYFSITLFAFFIIGVSTSALFFSALLTCAKLYPKYKFLSISCPTTFYGLSSLLGSEVLKHSWFSEGYDYLNLGRVFKSFAYFYAIMGTMTWVSTSIVTMLKEPVEQEEHERLLPTESNITTSDYKDRIRQFVRDPSMYLTLLTFFLTIGSLEMFLTNMGSVAILVSPQDRDIQPRVLSYYALFSTISRLIVGLVADFFAQHKISRMWILYGCLIIGLGGQLMIFNTGTSKSWITTASALCGTAYGGLFTIFPTLTLGIWGYSVFGTAYGCFMVAPAIGSTIYGVIYARTYDSQCTSQVEGAQCIRPVFSLTAISFLIALTISVFTYMGFWRRKRLDI
ncbi:LANO_0H18272g1_1 [Lachancea nothofagi CBS 11611]|uniref:Probable transporter MCH1 n=1 Tax=Lachancea nothofagi CBS 11611 TaxID=1266666 RepID=A0A1G4KN09_9SACH|nr:LANO_0H18272g1_1 [Lachancea nothofagi CBS 11611]